MWMHPLKLHLVILHHVRSCGPFDYKVRNMPDDNQPRNILEEIVWYKAKEIDAWRDKVPLAALQVGAGSFSLATALAASSQVPAAVPPLAAADSS